MKNISTQLCIGAMLIAFVSVQAQDSLFISELADPADDYSGRFIELYNAGSEAVDFSTAIFYLSRQSNGGTSWGDLQLAGTVAAGATFVIGGSGYEALYGKAPDQESGILIGNGDDAYALFTGGDHETGIPHDILLMWMGQVSFGNMKTPGLFGWLLFYGPISPGQQPSGR